MAVTEHGQPDIFIDEEVLLVCGGDELFGRPHGGQALSVPLQGFAKGHQAQIEGLLKEVDDAVTNEGIRQILVDKKNGVNYLCWNSGFGASITPLLDSEGKVIVTK